MLLTEMPHYNEFWLSFYVFSEANEAFPRFILYCMSVVEKMPELEYPVAYILRMAAQAAGEVDSVMVVKLVRRFLENPQLLSSEVVLHYFRQYFAALVKKAGNESPRDELVAFHREMLAKFPNSASIPYSLAVTLLSYSKPRFAEALPLLLSLAKHQYFCDENQRFLLTALKKTQSWAEL